MNPFDFIKARKKDYQLTFGSPWGHAVLKDLVKFCRGTETTFHSDARVHAALEGRREVLLRIQKQLNLSSEDLYALATGKSDVVQGERK